AGSDVCVPAQTVSYRPSGPVGASIDANGVITWTPTEAQGPSTNTFTTIVTDGEASATNSFVVIVEEVNNAPTLGAISEQIIAEETLLTINNAGSDVDVPAQTLSYQLSGPVGASIDANGVITWTPTEAQGPSTNTFTTVVTDGEASATNSFVVIVEEVNHAPTLDRKSDVKGAEETLLTINNAGSDVDVPVQTLSYQLSGPVGASIDANGVITWTPTEAQGPSTNTFTTVVTDGEASATNSFVVIVEEVNHAPT